MRVNAVVAVAVVAVMVIGSEGGVSAALPRRNANPFVLMHGFAGWGRDELLGLFKYWGGFNDVQEILKNEGHEVVTVSMGPVSSNWDRACEAYAQLFGAGAVVDYGQARATEFGYMSRYGDDFTGKGLLPNWGEGQKIHIIAHSQGGQTARVLAHMLRYGRPEEVAADPTGHNPLFAGGRDWVHSITMLSTPNKGTTLATGILEQEWLVSIIVAVAGIAGLGGDAADMIYDLDLDHFGFVQEEDESWYQYIFRVLTDPALNQDSEGFGPWDLRPEGARKLSEEFPNLDNVYYLTYENEQTYSVIFAQLPEAFMFFVFWPFATIMGALTGTFTWNGHTITIDKSWHENDGVVNRESMACAYDYQGAECDVHGHLKDPVNLRPGIFTRVHQWHMEEDCVLFWCGDEYEVHDGFKYDRDHFDMISDFSMVGVYKEIAMQAAALPDSSIPADLVSELEPLPEPEVEIDLVQENPFNSACDALLAYYTNCHPDVASSSDLHACVPLANEIVNSSEQCDCDIAEDSESCHAARAMAIENADQVDDASSDKKEDPDLGDNKDGFWEDNQTMLIAAGGGGIAFISLISVAAFVVHKKRLAARMRSPTQAPLTRNRIDSGFEL